MLWNFGSVRKGPGEEFNWIKMGRGRGGSEYGSMGSDWRWREIRMGE